MLDNPIWSALTTVNRPLAQANALAARYLPGIAPLGGMRDQSAESYAAMEELLAGDAVALFLDQEPVPPAGWEISHRDLMHQMIYEGPLPEVGRVRPLNDGDVPEMLALTALTEPGPFRERTIDLGGYIGIFESGRLAAMAGERLHMTGFTEVSAVCTHPDFRGQGYGKACVAAVVAGIMRHGETAILHVRCHNSAVALYESLGFRILRQLHLVVLRCAASIQLPSG
jgi:ribosomal protein S18 acetylase RimI-like enzyme